MQAEYCAQSVVDVLRTTQSNRETIPEPGNCCFLPDVVDEVIDNLTDDERALLSRAR